MAVSQSCQEQSRKLKDIVCISHIMSIWDSLASICVADYLGSAKSIDAHIQICFRDICYLHINLTTFGSRTCVNAHNVRCSQAPCMKYFCQATYSFLAPQISTWSRGWSSRGLELIWSHTSQGEVAFRTHEELVILCIYHGGCAIASKVRDTLHPAVRCIFSTLVSIGLG